MFFGEGCQTGRMELPITLFFQGCLAGLCVTAPVGPICILCIQRSIRHGRIAGIATGFGSAVALMIYGTIGFASLGYLASASPSASFWPIIAGAVVLSVIGYRVFTSDSAETKPQELTTGIVGDALSSFFLEIINLAGIMIFVGLFVGMPRVSPSPIGYGLMALGIFFSSMAWWGFLAVIVAKFQHIFTPQKLLWLNRVAGIVIVMMGLRPLWALIFW